LDNNKNITRVEIGPLTFVRQDHEKVLLGPERMVTIPPRHYCLISNPVLVGADKRAVVDEFGQARVKHGDQEIRFHQDPFPLYPGEKLASKVTPLLVLPPNKAIRLRATRDFEEDGKVSFFSASFFSFPLTFR
jgi:major vault protein